MTENVWRTEAAKGWSRPSQSHWRVEQIVCHLSLQVTLFGLIMCLLTVGLTRADYQAGVDAYERGDYHIALQEWQPLAEDGSSKAQFHLGRMYARGNGVPQDDEKAAELYRKAAQQGHGQAQYFLGGMYMAGRGVAQDDEEAAKWYQKAAQQGEAKAQYFLGRMYLNGWGVVQDDEEAVKWYRKAAQQGEASAQFSLGVMYENGEGVPQDYVTAHVWYNLAGAQSDEEARKARDRIAEKMTPAQIAEAQRWAREWKPKSDD